MSTAISLSVESRTILKKQVNALRHAGKVPGVIYGYKTENQAVQFDAREALPVLRQAGGTTIIKLKVDGDRAVSVLLHDMQHGKRGVVTHVDFLAVNLREKMIVSVPLVLTGEAPIVTEENGTINLIHDSIEVECLPTNIPHEIEIDITGLVAFDNIVAFKDLPTIEDVVILGDPEEVLITITEPMSEEALAALDEPIDPVTETEEEEADGEATEEEGDDQGGENPENEGTDEEKKTPQPDKD